MKKEKYITDIIDKIPQYGDIEYVADYKCPECGKSGFFDEGIHKPILIGWVEGHRGCMAVMECPDCGYRYMFHLGLDKFDAEDFAISLECTYIGKFENGEEIWKKYMDYWNNKE